jgi:hypothetical protein
MYRQLERAQLEMNPKASGSKSAPVSSKNNTSNGMGMFQKERKVALTALGHDVGLIAATKRIKPSKHHGKAARRRFEERSDASAPAKLDKRSEKKTDQLILEVTNQNKEVRDMLRVLSEAETSKAAATGAGGGEDLEAKPGTRTKGARKINKNFWNKYETLFPIGSEARMGRAAAPSPPSAASTSSVVSCSDGDSASAASLRCLLGRPEQRFFNPTRPRHETILRKDYSANRWSVEERSRLNALFWDVQRPVVSNKDAWNDYLNEFTVRFQAYYPARPQAEVRAKVKHMIKHRAMKVPGEQEYWSSFRRARAGRDGTTLSSDEDEVGIKSGAVAISGGAAAFRMQFDDLD